MTRYTPLWLQAGSYPAAGDRRLISAIWPAAVVSGCAVTVQANMNLNVGVGWVVVPTANNTGSVLCASDSIEVVTLGTAPGAGTNRIDVVACTVTSTDIGTAAGDAFSFTAIAGTPAASPVAPAVPAGSVAIAQVLVIGGQATIQAGNITDRRAISNPRDLYHTRVYRSAAFTLGADAALIFDTVQEDAAGLYNLTTGDYRCPAAGTYLINGKTGASFGAAGQNADVRLYKNGTLFALAGGLYPSAGAGMHIPFAVGSLKCAAGDVLSIHTTCGASVAGLVGAIQTYASFDYLGTG